MKSGVYLIGRTDLRDLLDNPLAEAVILKYSPSKKNPSTSTYSLSS